MQEKARVTLTTGQIFYSPVSNLNTIRRIYAEKVESIEYPEDIKPKQVVTMEEKEAVQMAPLPETTPEPMAATPTEEVQFQEFLNDAPVTTPQPEPEQPKEPEIQTGTMPDHSVAKNRLKKINTPVKKNAAAAKRKKPNQK